MNENKRKEKAALMSHLMILLSKFCHKQFCIMSVSYRTSHTFQHSTSWCHATPEHFVWSLQSLWDFWCLFDDIITKPCPMDLLCSSKMETEKRNDHFSYWPLGCCFLRLPQKPECPFALVMNHLFLLALLLPRTTSTMLCHLGVSKTKSLNFLINNSANKF